MPSRPQRHRRIVQLIGARTIHSQKELGELLAADGIDTTQATLSRDLHELGVSKGPAGYVIASEPSGSTDEAETLRRTLQRELLSAEAGGTLVVLHTWPGHANALAIELDRSQLAGVLGTIAGDDTIFIAVGTESGARQLVKRLRSMAGHQ